MTHFFISYAKADTKSLAFALEKAFEAPPHTTAWVDKELRVLDASWSRQIEREIRKCDYMIVLLSPDVNRSEDHAKGESFVLREIRFAQQARKRIIPVMAQQTDVPIELIGGQYIDFTVYTAKEADWLIERICAEVGIQNPAQWREEQRREQERLRAEVAERARRDAQQRAQAEAVARQRQETQPLANPNLEAQLPKGSGIRDAVRPRSPRSALLLGVVIGEALIGLVILVILGATIVNRLASAPTNTPQLNNPTSLPSATSFAVATITRFLPPTPTDTPTNTQVPPTETTVIIIPTATITPTFAPTSTPIIVEPATQTPTPTDIPTNTPNVAIPNVLKNVDWTPQIVTFDGVAMVLVPSGCFQMGSNYGYANEKPDHQQCFDQAFYLDRYEVTNEQFAQFGGQAANASKWTDAKRPREQITWFEARDFCAKRGARLPTEAEWEYAARGPDRLIYPWGNTFVADNVVYGGNSGSQTASVGSRPFGVSWVGALDMSGNVWEWVSSIYQSYPYVSTDGRESSSDTNSARVLRGGSWYGGGTGLRAAFRNWDGPAFRLNVIGVRCARSF